MLHLGPVLQPAVTDTLLTMLHLGPVLQPAVTAGSRSLRVVVNYFTPSMGGMVGL